MWHGTWERVSSNGSQFHVVYDEPPEPVRLVADDGTGDWMVCDDHVEAQTGGTFEVRAQEIRGHDVNGNVGS